VFTICTISFSILKCCILLTESVCVFRRFLTINSESFPKQHLPVGLCGGDVMCFLWGTNWTCTYYLEEIQCLKGYYWLESCVHLFSRLLLCEYGSRREGKGRRNRLSRTRQTNGFHYNISRKISLVGWGCLGQPVILTIYLFTSSTHRSPVGRGRVTMQSSVQQKFNKVT
jgi:hypothetical protein